MSATEIIEMIKELPEAEKLEVYSFLRDDIDTDPGVANVAKTEVDAALKKVFRAYDEDFKLLAK